MRIEELSGTWNREEMKRNNSVNPKHYLFDMLKIVFLVPLYQFLTLDDNLFGTCAKDNAVKFLSPREADVYGHVSDSVSDALFRITLDLMIKRRGETIIYGTKKSYE